MRTLGSILRVRRVRLYTDTSAILLPLFLF